MFRHLQTLSSSRKDVLISAHSLLITALSSAAVLAALICLIKSLSRIGVGIRTKPKERIQNKPPSNYQKQWYHSPFSTASLNTCLIVAILKAGLNL